MISSQALNWIVFIALNGGCLYVLYQLLVVRFLPVARQAVDPSYFGTTEPQPFEWHEFQRWLRIGVTAGAGGIAGGLAADAITEFYSFIRQGEFSEPNWPKIASALILAFIGMKLFGPIHALFERRLNEKDRLTDHPPSPGLTDHDEWEYAVVAGGLIFILLLLDGTLNAALERQLEKMSTEFGGWGMMLVLASTAFWPGITAFYWAATLTRQSKHGSVEAFLATWTILFSLIVGILLLFLGSIIYNIAASGNLAPDLWQRSVPIAIGLAIGLVVILVVPALVAAFTIVLPAAIGMEVILSARQNRRFKLLLAMCLYDFLTAIPFVVIMVIFHGRMSKEFLEAMDFKGLEREMVGTLANSLLVPMGWVSALLLDSRFRTLMDQFPLTEFAPSESIAADPPDEPAETPTNANLPEVSLTQSAVAPLIDQNNLTHGDGAA